MQRNPGRAMTALGFVRERSHGRWGYHVVAYSDDEIRGNKSVLAYDAKPEPVVDISELVGTDAGFAELF